MGLIFFALGCVGLILAIRRLIKGQLFDWWRMWKVSAGLVPVECFQPVTPKMQKEARLRRKMAKKKRTLALSPGYAS
jgi:transposase-like protein